MNNKHPYHLVNPSPWPISVSAALLGLTIGGVSYFHSFNNGIYLLTSSFILLAILAGFWWRDLIREGTYLHNHTKEVLLGLRLGFILFIVSEVMFFFSFFWAYFHSSLSPNIEIGSQWPPFALEVIGLALPVVNTVILLTSGATITVAHLAILRNKKQIAIESLIATIVLALVFTAIQMYEYRHAPFSISDGIYGSVFYMLTGFHGIHVLIGTIFICVQFVRLTKDHLLSNSHLGFEACAWYWHFVDVVWLLLFVIVYAYGSNAL
uniref:Cytochrome c oxidase subunit 3 n=1 Tax=Physarum polycephalum TaxID=5791 RepID=Q9XKY6_PHYPO|nr:cytochrome oxidase subunit 3 [Physarum polycephalum]AAD30660.1 cytochrome oxidase subunit 3 [Physarum polycephalum]